MHYQKGTQENIEIKVHVRWMNHLYDGDDLIFIVLWGYLLKAREC